MTRLVILTILFCFLSVNEKNVQTFHSGEGFTIYENYFKENSNQLSNALEISETIVITVDFKPKILYKIINIYKITEKKIFEFRKFSYLHKNLSEITQKLEVLLI